MFEVLGSAYHAGRFLEYGIAGFQAYKTIEFASGILSPGVYMDNRLWPSYPDAWEEMVQPVEVLARKLSLKARVDTIASVESAGIMHGAVIAASLGLPFVYVRKSAKGHGAKRLVEGDIERAVRGKRVLLIEDVGTMGDSSLNAAEALRACGGIVSDVAFLVVYGFEKMLKKFEVAGLDVSTVTTFEAILAHARGVNIAPTPPYEVAYWHLELVHQWLKDPEAPWVWPNSAFGLALSKPGPSGSQ